MKRNIMLTVLVVVGFGCQTLPLERDVQRAHDEFEKHDSPENHAGVGAETGMPIVGFTSMGEVVVFDGQSGEIKSTVAGGGGTPRDVAMDPWREGVWVFEENEDASAGEILFCPLEAERTRSNAQALATILRPCEHAVWIDGTAAMLPTEDGLWVFEYGIGGARWKILREGEVFPSTSAPRPVSIRMENGVISAFSLGFQNDRVQMLRANFDPTGPKVLEEFNWGQPSGYPPTPRHAWLANESGLWFDAVSDRLTVRRVNGGDAGLPMVIDVGIPVSRIEAAVGMGTSALVLGRDALWIVQARDTDVELVAGLWLHGDVRDSSLFFSRDLLVASNRAFVGTDRGVRAVGLEIDGDAVVNVFLDEQFVGEGLRGPLDMVRPYGW